MRGRTVATIALLVGALLLAGCGAGEGAAPTVTVATRTAADAASATRPVASPAATVPRAPGSPAATPPATPPTYGFTVVARRPHDRAAFTQGLVFHDGALFEGTGGNGESVLRAVDLDTGAVRRQVALAEEHFGEGIAIFDGKVWQLTWQSGRGFIYDLRDFRPLGEFAYDGEGWGLTHDGQSLIMSDGTPRLRFLDPRTAEVVRTVEVRDERGPVANLNELEYVRGEVYANVWQTDRIARIDPASGRVLGWIDLTGLLPAAERDETTDVLNGIAYDPATDRLFVTGKRWPALFEIRLTPGAGPP